MRIGLTGAQGVGKTTLAQALAQKLNLPLIEEQARRAAQELGIANPRELKGQVELGRHYQWRCLELQMKAEGECPGNSFISDRTVIDNAVYWAKWHAHGTESSENLDYYSLVDQYVGRYDLIVYVPPEFLPADDGFRSINRDYQLEIDFLIRLFLKGLPVRKWIEVRGTVEERVNQVLAALKVEKRPNIHIHPYEDDGYCD